MSGTLNTHIRRKNKNTQRDDMHAATVPHSRTMHTERQRSSVSFFSCLRDLAFLRLVKWIRVVR